jgi:phospholipase C
MPRMAPTRVTRRTALKQMGALAGAGLLAGCGGTGGGGEPDAGGPDAPGPDAAAPVGITHLVVMMMENRSYDHYLGARGLLEGKPGDGLEEGMSNPDLDGVERPIFREETSCVADPPHSWNPCHAQWNQGANDGFVRAYQQSDGRDIAPHVMGYFGREELPVHWALADHFTSCDRWFSALLTQTWPNRFYFYAAQSDGIIDHVLPDGRLKVPTVLDRLNEKGVPWTYYFGDIPFLALFDRVASSDMRRLDLGFFDQAASGTLPPVSFIDPSFSRNDDHPPHHPILGQQLIGAVYAALAASPLWNNLLFVVTYDEHGGFFDHVAPPTAPDDRAAEGFGQLGFRVPTLVAGPYVKQGHVSSVVRNHASITRHIENMFGLAPLTMRDAAAADLGEVIDTDRLARGEPLPAPPLPAVEVDESMLDATCFATGGGLPKPGPTEIAADTGVIPKELDFRRHGRDQLYYIGDVLDRYNAGRIRRGR